MHKLRFMLIGRLLSILAMTLFILPLHVITAFAEEKATTKIQHKPLEYYIAGNRIQIETKVEDAAGVKVVRCYFRAVGQDDYVFVPMQEKEKGIYQSILPAPANQTASMEYLFLVVTGQNRVIKSQIITVNKRDQKDAPSWQMVGKEGPIPVSTEISQTAEMSGYFADNISLNVVDPSLRYGYAAALYEVSKMVLAGNAAGSAASATSGGAVIAEAGGLSTGWYVGLGLAGLAVVGVAAGGGGGGGSGSIKTLVGQFRVEQGPQWRDNPPTYTCKEACALLFGRSANEYACSTVGSAVNRQAYTSIWGVSNCQVASEDDKKSTYYNCGFANCSQSAYINDHCQGTNYCFR